MSGRTSLTRFAGQMREPDPDGAYRAKKEAWQRHGILMVDPVNDLNWDGTYELKETLKALGNRLYGKRKSR
ncbi:hypothetical protein [Parasphingorhabdus sp.]|uniref:hypothetical protein n=1 Tax=Parasphingorhabdus sp. TaxID=2709688 RepID=UPI003A924ABB